VAKDGPAMTTIIVSSGDVSSGLDVLNGVTVEVLSGGEVVSSIIESGAAGGVVVTYSATGSAAVVSVGVGH
jgi:hypothetical protein